MKKIIYLIVFIFLAVNVQSQIVFSKDDHYKTYNGVAGDTLNSSYILAKYIYLGLKDFKYNYYIECDADSAGDGTDITVRLRGSMDGLNYTNIGSAITWGVTTTDTTFIFDGLTASNTVGSTIASHTEIHYGISSLAAFDVPHVGSDDFGADSITVYSDTLEYPAQITTFTDTVTVAGQTITTTESISNGVAWRYLQLYFLGGGANADMSIPTSGNPIRVRILKTE